MAASIDPNQLALFIGALQAIITGNMDSFFSAMAVAADILTIGAFVKELIKNNNFVSEKFPARIRNKNAESFILGKHKILQEKNIKLDLSLGNLHLNYEARKKYQ